VTPSIASEGTEVSTGIAVPRRERRIGDMEAAAAEHGAAESPAARTR
jgi:hypothetical protein